ncbi:MAG: phytanoyl-CoA dioxygenase family protein [Pseudomonadota bacterium]
MNVDDHKHELSERGLIHIPGVIDPILIQEAKDRIYQTLADQGLNSDNRWAKPGASTPWDSVRCTKRLKKNRQLRDVISPEVNEIVITLTGSSEFDTMMAKPQLLYSSPVSDAWTVPHTVWHLDFPRLDSGMLPGVQVFACVDRVEARGGGTLMVSGSHRLLNDCGAISSKGIKRKLKRLSYFRKLMSPGEPQDRVDFLEHEEQELGVPLSVVELTGEPGDIYVTDLRLLHTVAPNVGPRPRMVMTQRYVYREAMAEMLTSQARQRERKKKRTQAA